MVRDFQDDTWEAFNEQAKNKKIYVWGCGVKGKEIALNVKKFGSCWDIAAFIDSNSTIKNFEGWSVLTPNQAKEIVKDDLILISTDKPGLITQVLDEIGIQNYYSYFWLNSEMRDFCLQKNINEEKICSVKELLFDEYSKEVLDKIMEKRKHGLLDYTDIQESAEDGEYFSHEFFSYSDDEVLIDGGGYDGDTIEEFASFTKNKYKMIYSFEPDIKTGEKLKNKLYKYNGKVVLYPYGLYEKKEKLSFVNDNIVYSSHIVSDGQATSAVDCVCLDEIMGDKKITFLKMDIEGAEIPALKGAKNTIMKNKPKLAICIYHKLDDLLDIPLLIHSFVPEYKFYIRHFGAKYYGTILFATI